MKPITIEEMERHWVINVKLMANPLYVAKICKPEYIESPCFATEKGAVDWLMKNHGVKPWDGRF